jgi:hypothetical protein
MAAMSIGDWDEGTLARFIEDAIQRDPVAALVRQLQGQLRGGGVLAGAVVGATGAISSAGTGGWTSARTAVGAYTITYDRAFKALGLPVALPGVTAGALSLKYTAVVAGSFSLQSFNTAGGANADTDFTFIVVGV